MTLQQYLAEAAKKGVIDHALRAHVRPDGLVAFYIHPAHAAGRTCDFMTYEATVVPMGDPPTAGAAQNPRVLGMQKVA